MIHAICDFCGKDCDRTATLLSMTPFQNFARYHTDNEPYGSKEKTRSFVICYDCCKKHNLPNPYETYSGITKQNCHYKFEIMYMNRRIAYFKSYEEQKPSLNPPFSSVYICSGVLPEQIVFEEIRKK